MLKGTDRQHAGAIAFLVRVFGSRSTAGRVATPQDLSVTKQHRNDRWDRCTASAGDWQIITTTSHRSANQRYFMHNSATVHRMRMQSSALDSSHSKLCNDTSTGVVRHQITKWRRLQKVVSYDLLHHTGSCNTEICYSSYRYSISWQQVSIDDCKTMIGAPQVSVRKPLFCQYLFESFELSSL